MYTNTQTAVTEREASVIIARAGDFAVSRTSGGGLCSPIWCAELARAELRGSRADLVALWALVNMEDWGHIADRKWAHSTLQARAWMAEWFDAFGLELPDVSTDRATKAA